MFTPGAAGAPDTTATTAFELSDTSSAYGTLGYVSTPTLLASFNGYDGAYPETTLATDAAGDLFGTAGLGGADGYGVVFEIAKTSSGYASTPTILVSFNGSDGETPFGGLVVDADGDLFGTTSTGSGANSSGEVFEIAETSSGYAATPTVLTNFNGANGDGPTAGLVMDASGDLFGTTYSGGGEWNAGVVFEIVKTNSGYASTPTVLATFNIGNGDNPVSGLFLDASGDVFGTTQFGGRDGFGTTFEIVKTSSGYATTPTVLASFNYTDGADIQGGVVADSSGDLFGTAQGGGAVTDGVVYEIVKTSSGYASTPTVLTSFNGADGDEPNGALFLDASGDVFGLTFDGGAPTVMGRYLRSPRRVPAMPRRRRF